MNILMISRGFPTKKYPQWGCFEKDQAEALAKIGHNVVVVSVDSRFLFSWRKLGITHVYDNGVNYYNSFFIPSVFSDIFGWNFSRYIRDIQFDNIYRNVEKQYGKPDVIFGQFFSNTLNGVYLKNKYNIPLVGIEHAARFNEKLLDKKTIFQASIAYTYTDQIITVCFPLKDRIKYFFNKDSVVVHNIVDGSFFGDALTFVPNVNKIKFVTTGSLIHRKGFDLLPKAFAKLNLPKDKWEMNIIGGGEERENLQKQIKDLGLQDNIHLLGQKTKSEIVGFLKDSNVFILPSRNENFSVAVLEALACGLPVISSICGGIRECIFDFNGLLFPVDDVDALADAIKYIFENYQSYDRAKIAEDCKNRFSPAVIARQLTDIFEKVVEEHKQKQLK